MTSKKRRRVAIAAAVVLATAAAVAFLIPQDPYRELNPDRYVRICDYESMRPDPPKAVVTDAMVREEIGRQVIAKADRQGESPKPAAEGDTVRISYLGKLGGEDFPGNAAQGQNIQIGAGMIPEFEKAVTGKKAGDTVKAEIEYPADEPNQALAGRTAEYEIYVEAVLKEREPVYNEAFVKEHTGYCSKEEYETEVKKQLKKEESKRLSAETCRDYLVRLVSQSKFQELPKDLIKREAKSLLERYEKEAEDHQMNWESYRNEYLQADSRTFSNMITNQAKETVKEKLIIYKIAKDQGARVSEDSCETWLTDYIEGRI